MPNCTNVPKGIYAYYSGMEPSPKGRGHCARYYDEGTRRKGNDGEMWSVRQDKNERLAWKKGVPKTPKRIASRKGIKVCGLHIKGKSPRHCKTPLRTPTAGVRLEGGGGGGGYGSDPYLGVSTYRELIALNVRYLEGEGIDTPYHGDSVDEETLPLLADLVAINKAGYHTTEGQPAMKVRLLRNAEYIDNFQKSYVHGFFPRKMVQRLATFLATQPVYYDLCQIEPFRTLYNTFPGDDIYNLTKFRSSEKENDLDDARWVHYSNHRPYKKAIEIVYFSKYPKITAMLMRWRRRRNGALGPRRFVMERREGGLGGGMGVNVRAVGVSR